MVVLTKTISHRLHFWNTCGWSRYLRNARLFTAADGQVQYERMGRAGEWPPVWRKTLAEVKRHREEGQ